MFTSKLGLTGIAVLMAVVGAAILWKQARAKTCPAHNQHAGILAAIIGWGLLIFSLGLAVSTWVFGYAFFAK